MKYIRQKDENKQDMKLWTPIYLSSAVKQYRDGLRFYDEFTSKAYSSQLPVFTFAGYIRNMQFIHGLFSTTLGTILLIKRKIYSTIK